METLSIGLALLLLIGGIGLAAWLIGVVIGTFKALFELGKEWLEWWAGPF